MLILHTQYPIPHSPLRSDFCPHRAIKLTHNVLMPKHPSICCWRHIFQAEKSGKTNPPGWTHGRSKKGKPFAGCNYFLLLSLQKKKYFRSCWREARRKIGEWSSCGSPQVHHFLFLSRTFSFSFVFFSHFPCKPIPHFYNQFLDTLPFHCIKNQINDPEDYPPFLRCCKKTKILS